MNSYSQAGQDIFIRKVLKEKRNGYFLEIGSNDPIKINNTYILERDYNWKGIMVEWDISFLESYKKTRPNSIYIIGDAINADYLKILEENNFPKEMDYLQIDLEVENKSTLNTLLHLDNTILNKYKFATITFEHDIYRGDYYNTREISRNIFKKRGYELIFRDIKNEGSMFEDWYICPDLVDMNYINSIKNTNSSEYTDVIKIL